MLREDSDAVAPCNVCGSPADLYSERMNETERELLATLRDLESKVHAMRTGNPKPNFAPGF
jgi:hypothetical protein